MVVVLPFYGRPLTPIPVAILLPEAGFLPGDGCHHMFFRPNSRLNPNMSHVISGLQLPDTAPGRALKNGASFSTGMRKWPKVESYAN